MRDGIDKKKKVILTMYTTDKHCNRCVKLLSHIPFDKTCERISIIEIDQNAVNFSKRCSLSLFLSFELCLCCLQYFFLFDLCLTHKASDAPNSVLTTKVYFHISKRIILHTNDKISTDSLCIYIFLSISFGFVICCVYCLLLSPPICRCS